MAEEALCPVCQHRQQRHRVDFGCTANDGACECSETPGAIARYHAAMEGDSSAAAVIAEEPSSLDNLLKRADEAGGKFARQGERIRWLLRELEEGLAANAEVLAAERAVAALRRQLDEANAKLRGLKPGATARPATSSDGPTPREVRAWAAQAGVEVAPLGRIPGPVMQAYLAVHPEVSGG